jgi:formylglycine-generating enzyme required for sulfatase activity
VLLDFGLARDVAGEGQTLTQSGQILGTPAYLAPEQIVASRGKVDRRTDVYALGVTLFECLTLRRPFEQDSWDQLFNEILNGAPPRPRKLNPRIPRDLGIVIDVAIERDPTRRYATAEAFAEDLRRVRAFEPIQAQAAGPISRMQKWARRSPGRATSIAAAAVFALIGISAFVVKSIREHQAFRGNLQSASAALAANDFDTALVAIAQAREREPDSAPAIALQARIEEARDRALEEQHRSKDLTLAAAAREETVDIQRRYDDTRGKIEKLTVELQKDQSTVIARYATDEARAQFARKQFYLAQLEVEAERLLLSHEEALQRAARLESPWGGASEATERALAKFYLGRWREALVANDTARAEVMRSAVVDHDRTRAFEAELLGRGTLALTVVPQSAEMFLFRWESFETLHGGEGIPRLVPVPTAGIGRADGGEFRPGDECLVIRDVEPASLAARAQLRPGDLVVSVDGQPCRGTLFVREVPRASAVESAGVPLLARVTALNDERVDGHFDWVRRLAEDKQKRLRFVRFSSSDQPVECDPREIRLADALTLVQGEAPATMRLECLRGGEPVTVNVPGGARAGLSCELTAYPLLLTARNRLAHDLPATLDPGSYLVLARAEGHEDLRFNLVVERGASVQTKIELNSAGTTPPGFVWIPAGPFVEGGDASAHRPREARVADLPGFFMARKELTNQEWYEFVNDPETLAKIAATSPGTHLYLPQDDRVMARKIEEEGGYTWEVYDATSAESPVLGVSWTDVHDYLEWRNRRAEASGEPWRYDLPTEREWEKAARGADARVFPWGNRFDPSLLTCMARASGWLLDAPGGFEPRDESPFGLLDMGGSREEWLRDVAGNSEPPLYRKRSGFWGSSVEVTFRCASRPEASQDRYSSSQGLRLVLRKP